MVWKVKKFRNKDNYIKTIIGNNGGKFNIDKVYFPKTDYMCNWKDISESAMRFYNNSIVFNFLLLGIPWTTSSLIEIHILLWLILLIAYFIFPKSLSET